MANAKGKDSSTSPKGLRPATTPEGREVQLISLAVDLAEKQLREGTASSQVITHFLKLATTKAELEKEKLRQENKLLEVRAKSLESQDNAEQRYLEAIEAMKRYGGHGGAGGEPDDY